MPFDPLPSEPQADAPRVLAGPCSTALVWDATTEAGRKGAAAFFCGLGGPIDTRSIETRRASARRSQVALCGEAFVLAQEAKGFRAWERV